MHFQGLLAKGPPPVHHFLFIIKIALAVLAFGVFVAACYNVAQISSLGGYYYYGGGNGGLAIFTCFWTWFILAVEFFLGLRVHNAYFRIVFVVLFVLTKIFWLATWADAASNAASILGLDCGGSSFCSRYGGSLAAIAALGAFCWVLILAILIFYVLACLRDPAAAPNYQPTTTYGGHPNAELGNVKHDGTQQPFVGGQSSHTYGQPPYAQPQYEQTQPAPYSQ